MNLMELRKQSAEVADKFIHDVHEDQWDKQSNCTEWTVKQLVNHIVSGNYWEPEILAGRTLKEVDGRFDGDLVGNNPLQIWEKSIREANANLVRNPAVIDRMVHLSYGDVPCHEYLAQRILDLTIHGWDVAKSTGQDQKLPDELVQYLWDTFSNQDKMLRDSRLFGEEVPVPADAPLQTKLLAILGRQ